MQADHDDSPAALAIVGSYPPPFGGVGIHVQRLCALLDRRGVRFVVYNATSDVGDGRRVIGVFSQRRTWLLRYLLTAREPVIYIMSGRLAAWVIGGLMASLRGKRVLLRLRNASLPDWIKSSWWRRALSRFALRRMEAVICVSKLLLESAKSLGVPENRLHWSPGFLPPELTDDEKQQIAPQTWEFINNHSPVISANGKVDFYNGEDLYGLDHCVELIARLKNDFPNIGLVFCFSDFAECERSYLDTIFDKAKQLGVESSICLNLRPGPFVPVLADSTVFVRPSNTDGDAISVREARYLGIPTVASDAVARPDGVLLFKTRDIDALERQTRAALHAATTGDAAPRGTLSAEDETRIERYLNLLTNLSTGVESRH